MSFKPTMNILTGKSKRRLKKKTNRWLESVYKRQLNEWVCEYRNILNRPSIEDLYETLKGLVKYKELNIKSNLVNDPIKQCDLTCYETMSDDTPIVDNIDKLIIQKKLKYYKQLMDAGIRFISSEYIDGLQTKKKLGSGSYGICNLVVDNMIGNEYVIKTFFGVYKLKELTYEAIKLKQLEGNGVQKLIGVCFEKCQMVSYYSGLSMDEIINNSVQISTVDKYKIMYKITSICYRIIKLKHLHNDIKPANICIDNNLNPTIIDFGLSTKLSDDCTFVNDTCDNNKYPWIAPELFQQHSKCTELSEVYSLLYCFNQFLHSC